MSKQRWVGTALQRQREMRDGVKKPSAREIFAAKVDQVRAARPVIGETRSGQPIYGRSTFRNTRGDS